MLTAKEEWELKTADANVGFVRWMLSLSDSERRLVLWELDSLFCKECGREKEYICNCKEEE